MKNEIDERMLDLLCDQALFGLSEEELQELARFGENDATRNEALSLELTAAKLNTAGIVENSELPEHLFASILAESKKHVAAEENVFTAPRGTVAAETSSASSGMFGWLGWAVAAAACIALAFVVINRPGDQGMIAAAPTPTPTIQKELTPAELRQQLLNTEQAVIKADWGKGNVPEAEGISGDVVWSDDKQTGYMRIRGLPVNDKNREQYQLWIFENAKLEEHPKDGGVFDVNSEGEVIIPIDAKILTRGPKAFAITVEKPGGVVVSSREKIAGLAAVKPSQS